MWFPTKGEQVSIRDERNERFQTVQVQKEKGLGRANRKRRRPEEVDVILRAIEMRLVMPQQSKGEVSIADVYKQMESAARWAYNEAVAMYNTWQEVRRRRGRPKRALRVAEAGKMRDKILERVRPAKGEDAWMAKFPMKLFQNGIERFHDAVKSSWAAWWELKKKGKDPRKPRFKFQTRKSHAEAWSFSLPANTVKLDSEQRVWASEKILKKEFGVEKAPLVRDERVKRMFGGNGRPSSAVTFKRDLGGRYSIIVIERVKLTKRENQAHREVALDPGKRTFLTGYSPQKWCGDVDMSLSYRLEKRYKLLFSVQRALKSEKGKKRKRLLRRRRKIEQRSKDLVSDAHFKIAHWLCQRFEKIIIGKFSVQGVVSRSGVLKKMTRWIMLRQGHFAFRQRLRHVASQYGCDVHEQNM